ncbi:MAG TPA: 23S rRNA (adenine(2503)-C(2))-methyltransferase RlmN [Mycobacteriales bacterium]|nr:23S rRNA (adenine(2503)-C(2))-methyltransferase RlmN [Mycobacteriales bacterium]
MSDAGSLPRPHKPPRHLADLEADDRKTALIEAGEPGYRAEQLSRNYFAHHRDLAAMTDVPAADRERLAAEFLPQLLEDVRTVECDEGRTRKTLWRLGDGSLVESVLMRYPDRVTMCVSSQAGCGMGCPFCATGQAGLTRNLSAAEIVEQIVVGGRGEVDNVVFMGMGEPLANYSALIAALHRLIDPIPGGVGIGQRHITVSTVGLVPGIDKLAAEGLQVNLAVSLHAPDDELRDTLVPINLRWKVAEVLDAAWRYAATSKRRVSFEYAMIRDVNDSPERAHLLGELLSGHLAHVNLIPLNPTPGSAWTATTPDREREMVRILRSHGVPTTVRDTRGREIDGACGQLAATQA